MLQEQHGLQGTAGCQDTAWTTEAGGYLRQILNARVYDVAVHAPNIQPAARPY